MMVESGNPQGPRGKSFRKHLLIRVTNGKLVAQKWPRPRGRDRHPIQKYWSEWLAEADAAWKLQPAVFQIAAEEATRGGPLLPRDLFIAASRGRLWSLMGADGVEVFPMSAITDVSRSLDVVAQLPGMMLVRTGTLWVPVMPGLVGQVLTFVGPPNYVEWQSLP